MNAKLIDYLMLNIFAPLALLILLLSLVIFGLSYIAYLEYREKMEKTQLPLKTFKSWLFYEISRQKGGEHERT